MKRSSTIRLLSKQPDLREQSSLMQSTTTVLLAATASHARRVLAPFLSEENQSRKPVQATGDPGGHQAQWQWDFTGFTGFTPLLLDKRIESGIHSRGLALLPLPVDCRA